MLMQKTLIVGLMWLLTGFIHSGTTAYAATVKNVPIVSTFKPYMDFRKVTKKNSPQYSLRQQAVTLTNGLRIVDGRYMIAVGSYFTTKIGTAIDAVLDNGTTLSCIVGDAKADQHTNYNHSVGPHNDAIEFIVDTRTLDSTAKVRGDISYIPGFSGAVKSLIVYDNEVQSNNVDVLPDTITVENTQNSFTDSEVKPLSNSILVIPTDTEGAITEVIPELEEEAPKTDINTQISKFVKETSSISNNTKEDVIVDVKVDEENEMEEIDEEEVEEIKTVKDQVKTQDTLLVRDVLKNAPAGFVGASGR